MMDDTFRHLYIELKGTDTQKFYYQWGEITYNRFYIPKKVRDETHENYHEFFAAHISAGQKIDLFVHGMWGNVFGPWHDQHRKLYPQFKQFYGEEKNRVFISLIWDCTADYFKNVYLAKVKGKRFASVMTLLKTLRSNEVNIISHSLGNKLTEYMYKFINDEDLRIHTWITLAADLDNNIFDEGESLYEVDTVCERVYLFYHKNDRTLKISEFLNSRKRIGVSGSSVQKEYLHHIDVHELDASIQNSLSLHRYFYHNPKVVANMINILRDGKMPS